MDSGRKRRGVKGKLVMPFQRPAKASPVQYSKVMKPMPPPSSAASFSLIFVEDEFVMAPSKLKSAAPSSFVKREAAGGGHDHFGGYVDDHGIHGDHEPVTSEVDRRAANYISYVQERFRMERLDDDWRKYY